MAAIVTGVIMARARALAWLMFLRERSARSCQLYAGETAVREPPKKRWGAGPRPRWPIRTQSRGTFHTRGWPSLIRTQTTHAGDEWVPPRMIGQSARSRMEYKRSLAPSQPRRSLVTAWRAFFLPPSPLPPSPPPPLPARTPCARSRSMPNLILASELSLPAVGRSRQRRERAHPARRVAAPRVELRPPRRLAHPEPQQRGLVERERNLPPRRLGRFPAKNDAGQAAANRLPKLLVS